MRMFTEQIDSVKTGPLQCLESLILTGTTLNDVQKGMNLIMDELLNSGLLSNLMSEISQLRQLYKSHVDFKAIESRLSWRIWLHKMINTTFDFVDSKVIQVGPDAIPLVFQIMVSVVACIFAWPSRCKEKVDSADKAYNKTIAGVFQAYKDRFITMALDKAASKDDERGGIPFWVWVIVVAIFAFGLARVFTR
jgi:hypothetical protein